MDTSTHIVCPHCQAINRLPSARLGQHPQCGVCHEPLFAGTPAVLDAGNFTRFITKTEIPVLVDFWAPWCGPCKMMAPIFNQAAQQLEPKVRLAKLDTDAAQDIAGRFGIRSIPTLIIFKGGQEVARQSGALDLGRLVRFVQDHI